MDSSLPAMASVMVLTFSEPYLPTSSSYFFLLVTTPATLPVIRFVISSAGVPLALTISPHSSLEGVNASGIYLPDRM
ncbi:hypothetical protein D3C73_1173180 [compost metagenome]